MGPLRHLVIALAVGATACAGASEPAPAETVRMWKNPEPESQDLTASDTMWHHFVDVAKARDAVIAGKLAAVGPPLNRLAAGKYGSQVRPSWEPALARMRAEAHRGHDLASLEQAAEVVAAVAGHCGGCHRDMNGGPSLEGHPEGYHPMGHHGLSEAMQRHVWAAKELWLGITVPHPPAWQRGADTLAAGDAAGDESGEASSAAPATDAPPAAGTEAGGAQPPTEARAEAPPATGELQRAIEGVRELGERARQTTSPEAQQKLYAELITRCGQCHARMQVELPAE